MFYWHITSRSNVISILKIGLQSPVFVCNNPCACLRIREQQQAEGNKTGSATLLRIWLSDRFTVTPDEDTDYDAFVCMANIPPNRIVIEMENTLTF